MFVNFSKGNYSIIVISIFLCFGSVKPSLTCDNHLFYLQKVCTDTLFLSRTYFATKYLFQIKMLLVEYFCLVSMLYDIFLVFLLFILLLKEIFQKKE